MEPELPSTRRLFVRSVYVVLGLLFLAIGIVGYVVPGLPGTMFLLVAAWLFSMSNPRLYQWMMTNRWFGATLRDYRAGMGIPRRIKVVAVSAIVVSVTISVIFSIDARWMQLGLVALGLYGIYFILSRPTTETVRAAMAEQETAGSG